MCAGCGTPTHVPDAPAPRRFAALRDRNCGPYLVGGMLSMMADNVEHVITYWVLWQQFHSPALTGFQVISHWTPFLLLSVWFGGLADRYDCRRVVQAAQLLFLAVSLAWGVLFLTGSLSIPAACVLLVLHGTAGALWRPAEQMMLQDFVGREDLPSAVRLNSTFQGLGVLLGPVVGSALLIGLGAELGIFANALVYLPLTVFLLRTKFTGHTRSGVVARERVGALGAVRAARTVMRNPEIAGAIVVAGLTSLFVGSALQTVMPEFAEGFGDASSSAYGVLLFANGLGGVVGGIVLEATGWVRPNLTAAVVSTFLFGGFIAAFALSGSLVLAVVVLVLGGVANLVSVSVTQTIVQLKAEPAERGRTVGVYSMASGGLKVGSGFSIGLLGAVVGVQTSVVVSGAALALGAVAAGLAVRANRRPAVTGG
ncbi:MFS transporter [Kineococcus rhizosphaerae]|uniref:Transmembrane secretion effector n=1 Tax=Kineococcus rhizosphaerae TaxID=559628 RepID=A0A2T0R719_9ACTN|nr:MFS transporter [Kineococcus rhizosphaerae]PRY16966.1 transmembrane secretion effector [Kineococcus rhizosphaerae]